MVCIFDFLNQFLNMQIVVVRKSVVLIKVRQCSAVQCGGEWEERNVG